MLQAADLAAYPPLAKAVAVKHLALLQRLPSAFAALLLSAVVDYDWRFPAEQDDVERQLAFLGSMGESGLAATMAGFAGLTLSPGLREVPWGATPANFVEKLTAYLWSTHQMDRFRQVAGAYQQALLKAQPEPQPAIPRLCVVMVGRDAASGTLKLFSKLRPHGTYFNQVKASGGLEGLLAAVEARASAHRTAYAHWYVDGGVPFPISNAEEPQGLLSISYERLAPVRRALLAKVNLVRTSGDVVGPENLRSLLATLRPSELGANFPTQDAVRQHFEMSLLTEGSGTQIFSTTFVQWAGRELLRRARPLTLVLRYAPRQTERSMNDMLAPDAPGVGMDPAGSLVDADMGAYYTWVNLMRMTGAEQASFVVWFEGQNEALAAGPGMARGVLSNTVCDLDTLLHWLA